MSDHIIRKWRRDCWQEMSAGGMRVGMPHISVLCTDALRTCLEIEHLRAELAGRDAEIERLLILRRDLYAAAEAWKTKCEAERQHSRLPEELVERVRTAVEFDLQEQFGGDLVKRLLSDILAALEPRK